MKTSLHDIDIMENTPFQKNLNIACCSTCKHGNYCPLGDNDGEIFCLINYTPKDRNDVVDIYIKYSSGEISLPIYPLLHKCEQYEVMNDEYYTYNDWLYLFNNGE